MNQNKVGIFLKYDNLLVQLPVNPENITINRPGKNSSSQIVKLGDITNIGLLGLQDFNIQCFFPFRDAPYVSTSGDFKGPDYYIDFIQRIRKDRNPVRLIITDSDINMLVSIESFSTTKKWGTDDIDYSLSVKEYREHNVRMLSSLNSTNNSGNINPVSITDTNSDRPIEKIINKLYEIKDGDDLFTISHQELGNGDRWVEIYKLNIGLIPNPTILTPGVVLTLPNI